MTRNRIAGLLVLLVGGSAGADVIYSNDFNTGVAGAEWSDQTVGTQGNPFGTFLGRFERGTVTLTLGRAPDDGSGGDNPGGGGQPVGGVSLNATRFFYGARGGNDDTDSTPNAGYPIKVAKLGTGGDDDNGSGGGGEPDPGVGSGTYSLYFDLYLFDSWDGRDPAFGVDRFKVKVNGATLFNEALETFEPNENWYNGWERAGSGAYDTRYPDLLYRGIRLNFSVAAPGQLLTIDFISEQNQALIDESWGIDNLRVVQNTSTGRSSALVPGAPTGALLGLSLLGAARRRR